MFIIIINPNRFRKLNNFFWSRFLPSWGSHVSPKYPYISVHPYIFAHPKSNIFLRANSKISLTCSKFDKNMRRLNIVQIEIHINLKTQPNSSTKYLPNPFIHLPSNQITNTFVILIFCLL